MNLPAASGEEQGSADDNSSVSNGVSGAAGKPAVDRKKLDEIFGDVLPESTRDDRDSAGESGSFNDSWFTENRPPHHGG